VTDGEQPVISDYTLVTSSPHKAEEIAAIVGTALPTAALDLPEIQSLDLREVLRHKAREAFGRLGRPVVVEDVSLELVGLKGFPGPLVKWLLRAAGPEGLIALCRGTGEWRARAVCGVLGWDGGREVWAEGVVDGAIVAKPRGASGFGWDPVFVPDGYDRTYAEMSADGKNAISHRGAAWREFVNRRRVEG
jgi:non-canonical purine NTP pyrophosphatase (RdgB/HAM1 family)